MLFRNVLLVAVIGLVSLSTLPPRCAAADINWVGYQFGPPGGFSSNPFPEASFFHSDNWWNYEVPGSMPGRSDRAIFDEEFDPQENGMPRTIHFGDFTVPAIPIFNPDADLIPGGDIPISGGGTLAHMDFRAGDFTLDFDGHSIELTGTVSVFNNSAVTLRDQGMLTADSIDVSVFAVEEGAALLSVLEGAQVTSSFVSIGAGQVGQGTVLLEDAGSSIRALSFSIGSYGGSGTMNIQSGATAHATGDAAIGESGDGAVVIAGEGSDWSIDGSLSLGNRAFGEEAFGWGTLRVDNSAGLEVVGAVQLVYGSISAEGNSSIDMHGGLRLFASDGTGERSMRISSGSTANARFVDIGESNGAIVVQDAGSVLNTLQGIQVDSGTMRIENGADVILVDSDDVSGVLRRSDIGRNGTGSVTVTGSGSSWTTGQINIGHTEAGATFSGNGLLRLCRKPWLLAKQPCISTAYSSCGAHQ